tara:strand:+ start:4664 stop:5359 length:696 start_codon:yes stop_codon:yes gene_type:complete
MKIDGPLIKARLISRPNRFTTIVDLNGELHRSHLPDPGRLEEILIPGAELYLRHAKNDSKRKTKYSSVLVNHNGELISLVSTLPNQFIKESINNGVLNIFKDYKIVRPEISIDNHRIDFLLKNKSGSEFYLEVKSGTYVDNGIAKFPDAITLRGKNHVKLLSKLKKEGKDGGILFVFQRSDAKFFTPMWERDKKFSEALEYAKNIGVKIWCITLKIGFEEVKFFKQIPVKF